jgi:hypothetical protein
MYTIVNMVGYGEIWNVKSLAHPLFALRILDGGG